MDEFVEAVQGLWETARDAALSPGLDVQAGTAAAAVFRVFQACAADRVIE
jgi:hypothetical protein